MSTVAIRRVDDADAGALQEFYAALSAESRRRRFLGFSPGIRQELSRSFCTPDHRHAEGFVAVQAAVGPEDGRIVGHLCLEPDDQGGIELAVAVADDLQGRGIGRRLFEAALAWAMAHGITRISASAFADNTPVLRLLSSAPHGASMTLVGDGLVAVGIPLVPEGQATLTRRPGQAPRISTRRRPCAWRRRRRLAPAAGGSASRGSSSHSS